MDEEVKLKADTFWNLYSEHCVQGRHHESQRSTVVGVILAVAAAVVGIATFDEGLQGYMDAALGLFLIFLGLFGAGFSLKHYERFNLHMQRARQYREALDNLITDKKILELKRAADDKHTEAFPKIHKWRLHLWWVVLNLSVSIIGLAMLVIVVFS